MLCIGVSAPRKNKSPTQLRNFALSQSRNLAISQSRNLAISLSRYLALSKRPSFPQRAPAQLLVMESTPIFANFSASSGVSIVQTAK